MHRKPVLAANWKLNHTPTDARAFLQRFLALTPRQQDRTIVLFPSAITLTTVTDGLRDRPDIWVGVQNVHSEAQGAFTGENSVLMARDVGARVVLVGHSERRHVFGETDAMMTKKCALVAQARLIPMLCVGETLDERESGAAATVGVVVEGLCSATLGCADAATTAFGRPAASTGTEAGAASVCTRGTGTGTGAGMRERHRPTASPPSASTATAIHTARRRPSEGTLAGAVVTWLASKPGTAPRWRSASARLSASRM